MDDMFDLSSTNDAKGDGHTMSDDDDVSSSVSVFVFCCCKIVCPHFYGYSKLADKSFNKHLEIGIRIIRGGSDIF